MKFWLLFVSAILFIPNLSSRHLIDLPDKPLKNERFDTKLARKIQNTTQLINYIDSVAALKGIQQNTNLYAYLILEAVEDRFFYSYSHYGLDENWIAALGGHYVRYDISAIVAPDDILKYPMASCSQQSIVLMSIFRAKNIPYRSIGFVGHYAVQAKFGNQWIYFDANKESNTIHTAVTYDYMLKDDHSQLYYKNLLSPQEIKTMFAHHVLGDVNSDPAPHISVFHIVTRILSHWLWVLPMYLFLISLVKSYKTGFSKSFNPRIFAEPSELNLEYISHQSPKKRRHSYKEGEADK